jgi:hypothetical protein
MAPPFLFARRAISRQDLFELWPVLRHRQEVNRMLSRRVMRHKAESVCQQRTESLAYSVKAQFALVKRFWRGLRANRVGKRSRQ